MIRYLGFSEDPRGLLFVEASDGNLQAYLEDHNDAIGIGLRIKWRRQSLEAICYVHEKGVIHSDLRPENYLLHTTHNSTLDLYLCDFGGSVCGNIDGGNLPDSGFFDPRKPWVSTPATDIFSLGSIFYTIMTGHWPHQSARRFKSAEEKYQYQERVDTLFLKGIFPSTANLIGGAVIQGCWDGKYEDAKSLREAEESIDQCN